MTAGARMRNRALTAAALLLITLAAVQPVLVPPAALPADAPPASFSAGRAMLHVQQIAQRPRPAGSAENARVRQYIMTELERLGLAPEVQATTGVGTLYPVAGTVHNILATLPGGAPGGPVVLLVAHHDGVAAGPGAGDDASGVAVLLETARALRAGPPLRNDVVVLFTDAEEQGLHGAAAFVAEHPAAERVAFMMNFDARGTSGRSLMFETTPGNARIVNAFARAAPHATGLSFMYSIYQYMPNDTDFSELRRLDAHGLNFAFIGDVAHYHTSLDDVRRLDTRSVQHHGFAALALARHYASVELPIADDGDAIFFNVPLLRLITYPQGWTRPLAILASLALFATMAWGMTRRVLSARGLIVATAGSIVGVLLTTATVTGVWTLIAWAHRSIENAAIPELSSMYLFAVLALSLATFAALYRLLRRRASPAEVVAGGMVLWALLAVVTAFLLPGGSYVFTLPLLTGAAVLATGIASAARPAVVSPARAGAWLLAAVTLVIVTPIVAMIFVGLGMALPAVIATVFLTAAAAALMAEPLDALHARRWWVLPSALAALATLLVVTAMATLRHDAERPRANVMAYFLDAGSGEAQWLGGSRVDEWTRQFLGDAAEPVRATGLLAVAAPAAALTAPAPTAATGAGAGAAALVGPSARVLGDDSNATGRTLRLLLVAPPGAGALRLRVPGGGDLVATVNGRPIDTAGYRFPSVDWRLNYIAPPPEGIELSLTLPPGGPLVLHAVASFAGLPQLDGWTPAPRPPHLMPIHGGDATHVGQTFRF